MPFFHTCLLKSRKYPLPLPSPEILLSKIVKLSTNKVHREWFPWSLLLRSHCSSQKIDRNGKKGKKNRKSNIWEIYETPLIRSPMRQKKLAALTSVFFYKKMYGRFARRPKKVALMTRWPYTEVSVRQGSLYYPAITLHSASFHKRELLQLRIASRFPSKPVGFYRRVSWYQSSSPPSPQWSLHHNWCFGPFS